MWAKVHETSKTATSKPGQQTSWQKVNQSRDVQEGLGVAASAADEEEEAPGSVADVNTAPAPLWARVHEGSRGNRTVWQKVNSGRDIAQVDAVAAAEDDEDSANTSAPVSGAVPAAPAPRWAQVHETGSRSTKKVRTAWQTVNSSREATGDEYDSAAALPVAAAAADESADAPAPPPPLPERPGAAPLWQRVHKRDYTAAPLWQQVALSAPREVPDEPLGVALPSEYGGDEAADYEQALRADAERDALPLWMRIHSRFSGEYKATSQAGISMAVPTVSNPTWTAPASTDEWRDRWIGVSGDYAPIKMAPLPPLPTPPPQPVSADMSAAASAPVAGRRRVFSPVGFTISEIFDQNKWERHRSVDRYFRNIAPWSLFGSTVFRRVLKPCFLLAVVATAICAYNLALVPASMYHAGATVTASVPPLLGALMPVIVAAATGLDAALSALASLPFLESVLSDLPSIAYAAESALLSVPLLGKAVTLSATLPEALASLAPLSLNTAPFLLLAPVVGLLLVFHTNASLLRFTEAGALWGSAVRHSRDLARLSCTYMQDSQQRRLLLGYLQVWPAILRAHLLRSGRQQIASSTVDPTAEVRAALPADHAAKLLAAANAPYACLMAASALLRKSRSRLPADAVARIEGGLMELNAVTGGCERLLSTPMPLSYTRFTGRALMLWLVTMPLALWPLLGWVTVPTIFTMAYIMLGIDEIGAEIEEPFCILPLQDLANAIKRDVVVAASEADGYRSLIGTDTDDSDEQKASGDRDAAAAAVAVAAAAAAAAPPLPQQGGISPASASSN